MEKIKDMVKDRRFLKATLFITVNAAVLYILYFIIKNFNIIALGIGSGISSIISALAPLWIGLVLAYLLSPLVDIIDKKIMSHVLLPAPADPAKQERRASLRHFISIIITFLLIIAVIVVLIYAFAVLIVGQFVFGGVASMADSIVNYFLTYEDIIMDWAKNLPEGELADKIQGSVDIVVNWLTNHFSAASVISYFTNIGGSIVNIALGAIVSIYVMKDKDFFIRLWRKFLHLVLPQKTNAIVTETLHDVNGVLAQFIRGALLDALIIAVLSSIGLSILGLNFAVFIGCFAGLCNVIPYFGPILGMVPAFLVGTFTDGLLQGVIAVVILLVIQQIDCNIIYPKIVGSTTGLHPLFVLLAVTVSGYYGGILGMIIAVPIAGIIQVFVLKWVRYIDAKHSREEGTSDIE